MDIFLKFLELILKKSNEIIEEFKERVGFNEFENMGRYIQDIYQKYKNKIIPEQALLKTHKEIYSKISNDRNLETALWVVIAYFFEICDIGDIK